MPPSQAAAAHGSVVDTPPCGPACDRYDAQILVCLPPFDLAGRQWQRVRCVVIEGVLRSRSGLPEFPHSRANPRANGEIFASLTGRCRFTAGRPLVATESKHRERRVLIDLDPRRLARHAVLVIFGIPRHRQPVLRDQRQTQPSRLQAHQAEVGRASSWRPAAKRCYASTADSRATSRSVSSWAKG